MKKIDPKLAAAGLLVIIVLAGVFILRSAGVGRDMTPPPIAGGNGGGSTMQVTLPQGSENTVNPGGVTNHGNGSMTLPTPGGQ